MRLPEFRWRHWGSLALVVSLFGLTGCPAPAEKTVRPERPAESAAEAEPATAAEPPALGNSLAEEPASEVQPPPGTPEPKFPENPPAPVAIQPASPPPEDKAPPATDGPELKPQATAENSPEEKPEGEKPGEAEVKPEPLPAYYALREEHDPNGIGRFYQGREIAHVMGFAAAGWLERPEREEEERLSLLVNELKLKPGMVAADIGAGSGVITLMMAKQVAQPADAAADGEGGKATGGRVFAVDVQQEMLDLLGKKLKVQKVENVELILGTERSPRLPKDTLDLAVMVDVYHEFAWPHEMLKEISAALKPGGRLVFVEYRMEDPKVFIKLVHKMTEEQVKKEASHPDFRLKWKETIESLPQQHMVVFERQSQQVTQN